MHESAYLESVFPREALVTVAAWERFHRQVDTLVPLQVMVAIKALRTLVTFERSVVLGVWLSLRMAVELLHVCSMPAVERGHHLTWHASDERHLIMWVANIR